MTGQHERPAAARPYVRQPARPCQCGHCDPEPSPLGTEKRAMLYYGPGATDWAFETRVREGAWDDIPAEFDAAHARVHLPAIKRTRHIRLGLNAGRHHLAAVFAVHPDWRTDADVAEGLHATAAALAAQLDEMRRAAAGHGAEGSAAA